MTYVPPSDSEEIDLLIDQVGRLTENIMALQIENREGWRKMQQGFAALQAPLQKGFASLQAAGDRTERSIDRLAGIVDRMALRPDEEIPRREQQRQEDIAHRQRELAQREKETDRRDQQIDRLIGIVESLIQKRALHINGMKRIMKT